MGSRKVTTAHVAHTATNPSPSSLSPHATNAYDLSSQNVIPGLLNHSLNYMLKFFSIRTLCQVGKQDSLAMSLESRVIDTCRVSEIRIQDSSTIIHLTSHFQL